MIDRLAKYVIKRAFLLCPSCLITESPPWWWAATTRKESSQYSIVGHRGCVSPKATLFDVLRTLCSAVDPCLEQEPGGLLVSRSGLTSEPGIPPPANQVVLRDVLLQRGQITAAVQFDILQLHANLPESLVLPSHRQWRKSPPRMPRYAPIAGGFVKGCIFLGVATRAGGFEMSRFGAPDRWHMLVLVVSLQWMISGRVTIHATRMHENFPDLAEDRSRALGFARN